MWQELTDKRTRYGKCFKQGKKRRTITTMGAPVHYGNNQEIDLTPVKQGKKYQITRNGWHYELDQKGWAGFGGLEGKHWFRFRLNSMGFYHNGIAQHLDTTPEYNAANLSVQTNQLELGPVKINAESDFRWNNIFPGVDIRWRVSGEQLKEEIILTSTARSLLPVPTTPLDETELGFVFELDISKLPGVKEKGVSKSFDDGFDAEDLQLIDDTGNLFAFMPLDYVFSPNTKWTQKKAFPQKWRAKLTKHVYKQNGKYYLLVSAPLKAINELTPGEIIFDPTVNEQIGVTGDDGWDAGTFGWYPSSNYVYLGRYSSQDRNGGFRFQTVNVPQGTTVDSADFQLYIDNTSGAGDPDMLIYGDDNDDCAAWSNSSNASTGRPTARTRTTASVTITGSTDWTNDAWNTFSVSGIVNEILGRAGWAANNDMGIMVIENETAATNSVWARDYTSSTTLAAKLDITYTTNITESIPNGTLRLTSFAPTTSQNSPNTVEPVPSGALTLTSFAPNTKQKLYEPIPSATLTLTAFTPLHHVKHLIPTAFLNLTTFAPTVSQFGRTVEPVSPGNLTLTTFAPNTQQKIHERITSSNLNLVSFAPALRQAGKLVHPVPSANLRLISFAPNVPAISVPQKPIGGAKRKSTFTKTVIIGGQRRKVRSYTELRRLLELHLKEQQKELQIVEAKAPQRKKRIRVLKSNITRTERRLAKADDEWRKRVKRQNDELLLLLVA